MTHEGVKYDQGKLPYHLVPPEVLEAMTSVLQFGALKYGEHNWMMGMGWSRPFSALMRHMWAWWRGEPYDPETGYSHLWHALCCLVFLVTYEMRGVGTDDRPVVMPWPAPPPAEPVTEAPTTETTPDVTDTAEHPIEKLRAKARKLVAGKQSGDPA